MRSILSYLLGIPIIILITLFILKTAVEQKHKICKACIF